MLLMKESVLRFKENNNTAWIYLLSNCRQVLKLLRQTNPLNSIFGRFQYMLITILNRVYLSISSTRACFHKYCVAMKYRDEYDVFFYILSASPSFISMQILRVQSINHNLIIYFKGILEHNYSQSFSQTEKAV